MRNATGRRVVGGSNIGRIDVLAGTAVGLLFRNGCAGVPNAGDDEGTGSESILMDV